MPRLISSYGVETFHRPAFYCSDYNVGSGALTSSGSVLTFDNVHLDTAGAYDTANDRYECPISGLWFFSMAFHPRPGSDTHYAEITLQKNGTGMAHARNAFFRGNEATISSATVCEAVKGDQFRVYVTFSGGDIYTNDLNHFGGYFIG